MLWFILIALGGAVVWRLTRRPGLDLAPGGLLECPTCDLYVHGARCAEGASVLCGNCREFSLYMHGKLIKPAPDTVAPVPLFCAELPLHPPRWPLTCPLCDRPAARPISITIEFTSDAPLLNDMTTRLATLGMFKAVERTTITLDVPHCYQHDDGAALVLPYERDQLNYGIAFRSHRYFRQFLELNASKPRRATRLGGQLEE